jgi:hypothetical protein
MEVGPVFENTFQAPPQMLALTLIPGRANVHRVELRPVVCPSLQKLTITRQHRLWLGQHPLFPLVERGSGLAAFDGAT